MLTKQEIYLVVNRYIGVNGGYLGDFSYRTHDEFYPDYCDLDISPNAYEGTTRQRFIKILEESDTNIQVKILKGVLEKYPLDYFSEAEQDAKSKYYQRIKEIISRLEGRAIVEMPSLSYTNDTVERAIKDAKLLIENNGATSGVDRIHTTLYGYLKEVCKTENITINEKDTLTQLFKKLKNSHPKLQITGPRRNDIFQIINSFSNALDKLNPIRNKATLSHPNEDLLHEDEAILVINSAQTILNYLDRKLS